MPEAPLRLTVDTGAIVANWRWLAAASGAAACGAAVKADGYGIGAAQTVQVLAAAGCRDFFVATWDEAAALGTLPVGVRLMVLHGLGPGEEVRAAAGPALPVLNTPGQVARWREIAGDRACDVMVDTGMNRLGLSLEQATSGLLDGVRIGTLHSHLACPDDGGNPMNAVQLERFRAVVAAVPHERASLASSAGICLGPDYAFGLTRPGISLYGGVNHPAASGHLAQVARIEARVLQVRDVIAGESFGYGATWTATRPSRLAIVNLGYADGYKRAFSGVGHANVSDKACAIAARPVVGRVSMDLTGIDVTGTDVAEGDWLDIGFDLVEASAVTGVAQYELLTGLSHRYQRRYL